MPAGGFVNPIRALYAPKAPEQLKNTYLSGTSSVSQMLMFSSGTASLYAIFLALSRQSGTGLVAMSAYTCPDIASAVIKAGFSILPLAVDHHTLDLSDLSTLEVHAHELKAIVCSNLYGLPDRVEELQAFAAEHNILLVDDACQASMSARHGHSIGGTPDTIGVLSFGRGKGDCGVGGGAVVLNYTKSPLIGAVREELRKIHSEEITPPHRSVEYWQFCKGVLMWLFERPALFAIPSNMPFLRLGETRCELHFDFEGISQVAFAHFSCQLRTRRIRGIQCRKKALYYAECLRDVEIVQPFVQRTGRSDFGVVPIRYPIVFSSSDLRDKAYRMLSHKGLGVSLSYNRALSQFVELFPYIKKSDYLSTEQLAKRVITVPVHKYVRKSDIEHIAEVIMEVVRE